VHDTGVMSSLIRAPRADELEHLREIERAAGQLFRTVGLDAVAEDAPFTIDELSGYLRDGRAWVLVDDNVIVGYALVDIVDGAAHLEQLSVLPDHGRRGHGGALLTHVREWAAQQGRSTVTLTTFEHVPWNAPYYARHGFRVIGDDEIGPELRQLREEEAEHGLDPALRVCMCRAV